MKYSYTVSRERMLQLALMADVAEAVKSRVFSRELFHHHSGGALLIPTSV